MYDVQINNARANAIVVVGHRWEVQTQQQAADGGQWEAVSGPGVGGTMEVHEQHLPAGEAFRVRGLLSTSAPAANVRGAYTVRLSGSSASDEDEEIVEAIIGPLALSADDQSVPVFAARAAEQGPSVDDDEA